MTTDQHKDALALARELGRAEYEAQQLKEALGRRHWTQSPIVAILCWLIFVAVGIAIAPRAYAWWYGWGDRVNTPLPTAIVGRPTYVPAPTSDYGIAAYNEAQRERAEEANQEQGEEPAPAQQEQAAPVEQPAVQPTADEAAINAWLAAPPSTPTPLPEPGDPGFAASFQDSGCSPMIGYLPGHPCYQKPGDD